MAAGQGNVEYIGKIQLDASELMRVLGMGGGGGGGGGGMAAGGGGATGAGDLKQQENIKKGMGKAYKDPSFMSIFKPLVALEGLKSLVSNSRVANAYLGGMGKMFSAAIDLLLLPFTPIFNLLMVAMSKLIGWLIDSGVLEWVAEGVDKLVSLFGGFINWVKLIFTDPKKAFLDALKWLWGQIKTFFKDPLGSLKRVAQVAVAGAGIVGAAAMMPIIGGPIRGAIGAAAGGLGGMLGFGRGKGGGGGGGGGRGMGMGGIGMRMGGAAMGIGGYALASTVGQQGGAMGVAGRVGGLGLMGAGMGTMIAPGIGTAIGGGLGLGLGAAQELGVPGAGSIAKLFGAGKPGGGGGDTSVTGDIKNIGTQNITMNVYVQDKEMAKEIIKNVDEQMTASAEAG